MCQREDRHGPKVFSRDHIRVEKIKIAFLVPNIYEVSLYVILEVHHLKCNKKKKELTPVMSTNSLDREKICLFLALHRSVYIQFRGNGLEAHHEKGLLDVVKTQHFFFVVKLKKVTTSFTVTGPVYI